MTLESEKFKLPLNEEGILPFYWIDACEENNGADLYLFGKVFQKEVNKFVSCSVKVEGMQRQLFFLPKVTGSRQNLTKEDGNKSCMKVYEELKGIMKGRQITNWKSKTQWGKYAFEMPIPHGRHRFLKVLYPATFPPLNNLKGASFEAVFGANQSILELFLIQRKIMGPCWL